MIQSALSKNELLTTPILVVNKSGRPSAKTFIYARTDPGDANKPSYKAEADLVPIAAMVFDAPLLRVNPNTPGINAVQGFIARAKEADHPLVTLFELATGTKMLICASDRGHAL